MGFKVNKRIKIAGGLGVNVGKTKTSVSLRTKAGSVGSRGVSVKTGVKGVTYTAGKGKSGCCILLILGTGFLLKYLFL